MDLHESQVPSFDEWYEKKHGRSFEEQWMPPHAVIADSMKALTRAMREYVSEIVRTS